MLNKDQTKNKAIAYEFTNKPPVIACIFLSISYSRPNILIKTGGTPLMSFNSPSKNLRPMTAA